MRVQIEYREVYHVGDTEEVSYTNLDSRMFRYGVRVWKHKVHGYLVELLYIKVTGRYTISTVRSFLFVKNAQHSRDS